MSAEGGRFPRRGLRALLAVVSLAVLAAAGSQLLRFQSLQSSVRATAQETAARWAMADARVMTPEQACRQARELLQARKLDISRAWIEALERPDPVMAGLDQRVVRIHYVFEPMRSLGALGLWVRPPRFRIQTEGVVLAQHGD